MPLNLTDARRIASQRDLSGGNYEAFAMWVCNNIDELIDRLEAAETVCTQQILVRDRHDMNGAVMTTPKPKPRPVCAVHQAISKKNGVDAHNGVTCLDQLELAKIWLAERDRLWAADKPGAKTTDLMTFQKKLDEAREAFRKSLRTKR